MANRKFLWRVCSVFLIVFLFQFMSNSTASEHYDVLIKNAKIVDGTGKAEFKGSIAIKGDKIVAVGKVDGEANTVIDGTGLVACPGFIDPHSHADVTIMQRPEGQRSTGLPVGEWLGGDMIRCASGNQVLGSRSLPNGISYRLDTEISPPYPKSWGEGLFAKTFSKSYAEPTRVRDS